MSKQRFFILVLDGLRPDLATPKFMPHLAAFRAEAAVLANSRAQYPSHTRVNKTSMATGTPPMRHGIHFNKIHVTALARDRVFDIGEDAAFRDFTAAQPLLTAPTASRILGEAGRRFVMVHCAAPAAARIFNYGGPEVGQEHLAMAGYAYSTPDIARRVADKLGAMPPAGGVDFTRSEFALRAITDVIDPELSPDVTVMWCDEPDKSLHVDGLLGPSALKALAHCDSLVARAVAFWRQHDDLNLVILSDHGHVETSGNVALKALAEEIDLPVTVDPAQPGALWLPFGSGGLYLRDQSEDLLADFVAWMQRQEWCGTLFTRDNGAGLGIVEGTFSKTMASIEHARAPDLFYTLRRIDGDGAARRFAHCKEGGDKTAIGSTHGGLHREELTTVHFAAGPAYRSAYRSETPGGVIDVMPTVLHVLGVPLADTMLGRPLCDMLVAGGEAIDHDAPLEEMTTGTGDYAQSVQFRRINGRTLFEHGWRH